MNKKHICYYSVLRFCPYRETDEFANVGVVLACPSLGFLDSKLEAKRWGRISRFFPELDAEVFRDSLRSFRATIQQFAAVESRSQAINEVEKHRIKACFQELVRPRETVLYFSDVRVVQTVDPMATLESLFGAYIDRRFAHTEEYRETIMRRSLEVLLRENQLLDQYIKDSKVGNKLFHVVIPFVRFDASGVRAVSAIKPIDLDKDEPTAIIRHADAWKSNVHRLREFKLAPDRILFTVRKPNGNDERLEAFTKVVGEFQKLDIEVLPETDRAAVLEFARMG